MNSKIVQIQVPCVLTMATKVPENYDDKSIVHSFNSKLRLSSDNSEVKDKCQIRLVLHNTPFINKQAVYATLDVEFIDSLPASKVIAHE